MWSFGVGLFLIELEPTSLQLVAIYGFSQTASILLFGAIIGDWVDKTARLRAARLSLVLQNLLVIVCVAVVFSLVTYHNTLRNIWSDEGALKLCHAIIIILAILSDLASVARKIAVERDWIVEICSGDKDLLASMTAFLRAIDLTTAILAPVATGQIIHFIELRYGAVFIGGWNVVSVFVEYILMWKVFELVPALKKKKFKKRRDKEIEKEMTEFSPSENVEQEHLSEFERNGEEIEESLTQNNDEDTGKRKRCPSLCYKVFKTFIVLRKGWKTYMKYDVAFAGLGLAALYMTVMGFDNITVGYAYSQGISESILGILMAAGSIFGIAGTFAYPRLQKRIGLERTGLFGFGSEVFCLCFCVASVFSPGSPFDILHRMKTSFSENKQETTTIGVEFETANSTFNFNNMTNIYNVTENQSILNDSRKIEPGSYISISLYLGGLITARFGLWVADLTITQLFLQSVVETERGIVSGIQSSLNQLLNMLKFIMVILAPYPEEYGLLVLISFVFVCSGWGLYAKYSHAARGHLFHFQKICSHKHNNNLDNMQVTETGSVVLDVKFDQNAELNEEHDV